MSISNLKLIFENITSIDAWSLQLLQIKNSIRNGTSYYGREICIEPSGKLMDFVSELSERYINSKKGILLSYAGIMDYDGSTLGQTVYKLTTDSLLVNAEYSALLESIANPDTESDPFACRFHAYLLKGILTFAGEEHSVKLFSMQNPVTVLKHKFLKDAGTFKEIGNKVLTLRPSIDVVIYDDIIYMLTLAGENLFNMERSYKAICTKKIAEIKNYNIINDFEMFSAVASAGHNPRNFVSFNEQHLQKLKDVRNRRKVAKKFDIPLDDDDKFDTTKEGATEKIVKLLCNRGMIDPFDATAMEVAGSRKWS